MKRSIIRYWQYLSCILILLIIVIAMIQMNAKRFNPYDVSYIKESVFHYYNDHKHILLGNGMRDSSFVSLAVDELSDNPELSITIFQSLQVNNYLSKINIPDTLQTELIEKGAVNRIGIQGKGYMLLFEIDDDWYCLVEYLPT